MLIYVPVYHNKSVTCEVHIACFIFLLKTHDVLILTVLGLSQKGSSELGDSMFFRLNLVLDLTVGLVRPELFFRLTTKILTKLINTTGYTVLGNIWR